jgi:hypothetical protein
MKNKTVLLVFFLFSVLSFRAQSVMPDVIAASGDFFSNSSGQLQWTLGEVMVETYQNASFTVTQGFHQNFLLSTDVNTFTSSDFKIYPNPANEFISVWCEKADRLFSFNLMDITGKIVYVASANGFTPVQIDLSKYPNGIYLLKVTDVETDVAQSFRIIKTN